MIPFRKLSPRFVIYGKLKKILKLKKVNLVKNVILKRPKFGFIISQKLYKLIIKVDFRTIQFIKGMIVSLNRPGDKVNFFLGQPSFRISPKKV